MKKEAKRVVTSFVSECRKTFGEKEKYSHEELKTALFNVSSVLDENLYETLKDETKKKIEYCANSIHGICYLRALDMGKYASGTMRFRALQLVDYVDMELEKYGFERQSPVDKQKLMGLFDLGEVHSRALDRM